MKKHIVKALKWALNKFERPAEEIAAWPFPVPKEEKPEAKKPGKKPALKKATTRKVTSKKVK